MRLKQSYVYFIESAIGLLNIQEEDNDAAPLLQYFRLGERERERVNNEIALLPVILLLEWRRGMQNVEEWKGK